MKTKLGILLLLLVLLSGCNTQTKIVYDNDGCAYTISVQTSHQVLTPAGWDGGYVRRLTGSDKPTCNIGAKDVQNN